MTTKLPISTQQYYTDIVAAMVGLYQSAQLANLQRYHTLGGLFAEFQSKVAADKTAALTIDHLVADLQAAGAFPDIEDPRRFLYWARAVYESFPDIAVLEKLAVRGFTVSHAKLLYALPSKSREVVETIIFSNPDELPSTRELTDIIDALKKKEADDRAAITQDAVDTIDDGGPRQVPLPQADRNVEFVAEDDDEAIPATGDEAIPDAGPSDTPVPDGANPSSAGSKTYTKAPLAVMKDCDKVLTKLRDKLTDVAIMVREYQQIGYNNDTYDRKVLDTFRVFMSDLLKTDEMLDAVTKDIGDELSSRG